MIAYPDIFKLGTNVRHIYGTLKDGVTVFVFALLRAKFIFWEWNTTSSESWVTKNAGKSFQEREPLRCSYTAVFSVVTQTTWMLPS